MGILRYEPCSIGAECIYFSSSLSYYIHTFTHPQADKGVSIPATALSARHCQGDTVLIIQQKMMGKQRTSLEYLWAKLLARNEKIENWMGSAKKVGSSIWTLQWCKNCRTLGFYLLATKWYGKRTNCSRKVVGTSKMLDSFPSATFPLQPSPATCSPPYTHQLLFHLT